MVRDLSFANPDSKPVRLGVQRSLHSTNTLSGKHVVSIKKQEGLTTLKSIRELDIVPFLQNRQLLFRPLKHGTRFLIRRPVFHRTCDTIEHANGATDVCSTMSASPSPGYMPFFGVHIVTETVGLVNSVKSEIDG